MVRSVRSAVCQWHKSGSGGIIYGEVRDVADDKKKYEEVEEVLMTPSLRAIMQSTFAVSGVLAVRGRVPVVVVT